MRNLVSKLLRGGRAARAFGRDRRGNVAMMWAMMVTTLVSLTGVTVDFTRAQAIRSQMQNAVDGASLAAARALSNVSISDRTAIARAYFDSETQGIAHNVSFSLTPLEGNGYRVNATTDMSMSLAGLISNRPWTIRAVSDAVRGGMNMEVVMVLDTTGSMAGQRITDLRNSAGDLVDILLATPQTPYYTKIGLVTWSMGVNAGSYATAARGAIPGARDITNAAWQDGTTSLNISAVTKANPAVFTSNNHGLTNGQVVWLSGVSGTGNWATNLNGRWYTVSNANTNTFRLTNSSGNAVSTSGYSGSYPGSGIVRRCLEAACQVRVTSNNHGFANNAWVYITGVNGMTQINSSGDTAWQVTNVQANTYALVGSVGPSYNAYTNSGGAFCTTLGCQYYRFTNASNAIRILQISTCVSERVGSNVTTDAAPSVTPVGYNYTGTSNTCDSGTGVIPLTTNATTLKTRISGLTAVGSTAGQIGTAWGWYLLSPNWGYLWPTDANRPASYSAPETRKIAVLMTDGAFNSPYCNGVIAANALTGSGSAADHTNCNATNGSSAAQTIALCNAMKAQGIVVYTVGFHIDNDATALSVFHQCATSDAHFFLADDGTSLQTAFRQIGQSISQLRISH